MSARPGLFGAPVGRSLQPKPFRRSRISRYNLLECAPGHRSLRAISPGARGRRSFCMCPFRRLAVLLRLRLRHVPFHGQRAA